MGFTFYIFNERQGGEFIWVSRIAKKTNSEVKIFWDDVAQKMIFQPSGIANYFISQFIRIISLFDAKLSRGIYSILGLYTYKIKSVDRLNIVSTTHVPIPHGNNLIAYVHTPSRLLTVENEKELHDRKGKPLSLFYFYMWRMIYYSLYSKSLSKSKIVFANSRNTQLRLKNYMGIDSTVIYPSVDVENFYSESYENYFFYPSRISPQKRQLFALKAFNKFCAGNDRFRLILCSTNLISPENLKYLDEVKKYIEQNALPVEIRMGLDRDNIIKLYSNAYACLFTGIDEDFGQIPIESMAASKPIIAVKEGGTLETVIDRVTGYLVSTENEMAEKMAKLADNLEMTIEIGKAGRDRVEKNFSDDVFIRNLKNELSKIDIYLD